MRIWKQYDSQLDAISISQFLMMQHRCTQQLPKPDANTQPEPATSAVGTFTRSLNGSSLWFWFSLLLLSCFGWFYVSSSHCKLNSPQSDASAKRSPLLFYFIHCKFEQCLSVLCGLFWKERRTTRQSWRFFTVISAAVIAKAKLLSLSTCWCVRLSKQWDSCVRFGILASSKSPWKGISSRFTCGLSTVVPFDCCDWAAERQRCSECFRLTLNP